MASTEVYATAEEFRVRIGWNTAFDANELANAEALLAAASRTIDGWCNAQDGFIAPATGTAREYAGSGHQTQRIDLCVAVSLVEVKDSYSDDDYTAWAATDWVAFAGSPSFPNFNETPYEYIMTSADGDYSTFTAGRAVRTRRFSRNVPTVRVTARWGRYAAITDVPNVREATIFQAAIWYKRLESGGGDTLGTADFGVLRFRRDLDPAVVAMLAQARERRPSIA